MRLSRRRASRPPWAGEVELAFVPGGAGPHGRLELRLADMLGQPIERAEVHADLIRPTQAGHDFTAPFEAAAAGVYAQNARVPACPASGTCGCRPSTVAGPTARPGGSSSRNDRDRHLPGRRRRWRLRASADEMPVDLASYVRTDASGLHHLHLMVEGVHCGGCIRRIEGTLTRLAGVESARLNMSTRRLAVAWRGEAPRAGEMAAVVTAQGYRVVPFDPGRLSASDARRETELLRCLAVAGFAAANVMLLSVSVWAGHAQGMGPATRGLLHWFSALIAMPAIAYAGRPFFGSALTALRAGRTNMDVPISIGVVLATAMSLFEIIQGGRHAYFDSAVSLLFFLLIGRYLDSRARGRARSAAERLLTLRAAAVTVLDAEGRRAMRAGRAGPPGHDGPRRRRGAGRGRRPGRGRHHRRSTSA